MGKITAVDKDFAKQERTSIRSCRGREERRKLIRHVIQEFGLSERQACRTVQVSRYAYRHPPKKSTDAAIVQELRQLADRQPRWGCDKMMDYLRNQGHLWNHKQIRRVCRAG